MAQTCRLRLVVANDPRSYREAIATAIQRLQPDVEVMVVDPADLADQVERWRPHMAISSVPVLRIRARDIRMGDEAHEAYSGGGDGVRRAHDGGVLCRAGQRRRLRGY